MGGPSNDPVNKSKITGMGLKEDIDAAEAAAKSAVKGKGKLKDLVIKTAASALAKKYKLKPAAAVAPAPEAPAPEVGGKKKGKTGSALFKQKGQYPIELKQSEPLSADMLRKTDYEPADESKVLKAGAKKPRAASAWVAHCKAYAKEHGISYKAAMSAAKPSYKK
jgi:type III secretion system FlhB-like substrate exporter